MTRRIGVFSGTRADYGLLRRLALAIQASPEAELILIVSGSHVSAEHGMTSAEIVADGLPFAAEIPVWSGDDSAVGAARDVGTVIPRFAEVLERTSPDVVVILGDRLEAFAMATAAMIVGVPIAHVHGGELTEGAMDDALRHAITKMATLHFTSTQRHRRRVIQLGETPARVHFLGAPVIDALAGMQPMTRDAVQERFGVRLTPPVSLVTFHPAAFDVLPAERLLEELLAGLLAVDGLGIVLTGSNTDIGSTIVRERIAEFVSAHSDRVDYVESFGQLGYLSAMSHADVVVGNSSSTVLEAPVLGVPSVLVGDRQLGRPLAATVATPPPDRTAIAEAIRGAIAGRGSSHQDGIFGTPGFAERALRVLLETDLSAPSRKSFYDLPQSEVHT